MAEIIRFPVVPKLPPDETVEGLRHALAALEADEYFVRCAARTQALARGGDFAAAVAQIENLICFELAFDASIELHDCKIELALWLIDHVIEAHRIWSHKDFRDEKFAGQSKHLRDKQ
jgi:hypothetical protein